MLGFIRIACGVNELRVGDVQNNCEDILGKIEEADLEDTDLLLFPELAVTGYTCGDLFFQTALLEEAAAAVGRIAAATADKRLTVVVGAPFRIGGQLYNTAAVCAGGRVIGLVPKTFLPNYNEFYEKRWFSSASAMSETSASAASLGLPGDYELPVTARQVFDIGGQYKLGVEICEDVWTTIPPSSFLALQGAEVIANLSASNETIAKHAYRRSLVAHQSAAAVCAYAYVSAGAGESTTDLIFSGRSLIVENGTVLAENKETVASDYLLYADADLEKIRADRLRMKTFQESAALYGSLRPAVTTRASGASLRGDGERAPLRRLPFVPSDKKDRLERCLGIFEMQVGGLTKRASVAGGKLVVGVSGGLDSTLALLVATETVRRLGRPLTDVYGLTMPCFGTTDRTHDNAVALMKTLGISALEIPIREAATGHCRDIGHPIDQFDVTFENIQARERTQVLMDYACKIGGFVVGTGDLSELALGWCTYNADHMSMYGVNASIPKTLIRWMIDAIADFDVFRGASAILRDIIDTPISPELLPPDEHGQIAQETESIIGPYALHDFFLYYLLRYGFAPEKIFALACRAFRDSFDRETVLKWMKTFYRRFFTQQFKRSCLPDGVKIGSVCLSPRGDWRMPSDASARLWLGRLDAMQV